MSIKVAFFDHWIWCHTTYQWSYLSFLLVGEYQDNTLNLLHTIGVILQVVFCTPFVKYVWHPHRLVWCGHICSVCMCACNTLESLDGVHYTRYNLARCACVHNYMYDIHNNLYTCSTPHPVNPTKANRSILVGPCIQWSLPSWIIMGIQTASTKLTQLERAPGGGTVL